MQISCQQRRSREQHNLSIFDTTFEMRCLGGAAPTIYLKLQKFIASTVFALPAFPPIHVFTILRALFSAVLSTISIFNVFPLSLSFCQ